MIEISQNQADLHLEIELHSNKISVVFVVSMHLSTTIYHSKRENDQYEKELEWKSMVFANSSEHKEHEDIRYYSFNYAEKKMILNLNKMKLLEFGSLSRYKANYIRSMK